ncbi:MAG: hypothetical protein ABFC80_08100 [Coriobacteriales bacterium]
MSDPVTVWRCKRCGAVHLWQACDPEREVASWCRGCVEDSLFERMELSALGTSARLRRLEEALTAIADSDGEVTLDMASAREALKEGR